MTDNKKPATTGAVTGSKNTTADALNFTAPAQTLGMFERSKNGKIKPTLQNLVLAFEDLAFTGCTFRLMDNAYAVLETPTGIYKLQWATLLPLRLRLEKLGFAPVSEARLFDAARLVADQRHNAAKRAGAARALAEHDGAVKGGAK